MTLRFRGVRGSIPTPGPGTVRYGGNTPCIELRCGDGLVILDAGSGIRDLGTDLAQRGPVDADILLTHTHFDHIMGLPFFAPAYSSGNRFRMHAGHLEEGKRLKDVLCTMMMAPLFPIPMDVMAADKSFVDFGVGAAFDLGCGARVKTCRLNHPNGATGYRVEYGGRSVCYITDTEHREGGRDRAILDLIAGADVFIYDATYTAEEYPAKRGWGHSTWQEGADLAEEAGVGVYYLFHHDPSHDDEAMAAIERAAKDRLSNAEAAREGVTVTL